MVKMEQSKFQRHVDALMGIVLMTACVLVFIAALHANAPWARFLIGCCLTASLLLAATLIGNPWIPC